PLMGAVEVGLHDHRVVRVVERDQLIPLVGKGGARLVEVAGDLLGAVIDVAGADELVARVVEGLDRRVVLVTILRLHVLDHELLALAAKLLADGHARDSIPPGACIRLWGARPTADQGGASPRHGARGGVPGAPCRASRRRAGPAEAQRAPGPKWQPLRDR